MENKKRQQGIIAALAIPLIAVSGNVMRSQSFATIRTVDCLQLIAVGVLLGTLVSQIIAMIQARKK